MTRVAGVTEDFWRDALAESKGIRINLLAKELGVESKDILAKLHEEGLTDKKTQQPFKNHMAVLSVGQAETVRSWAVEGAFAGGGGTAVATAVEEGEAPPSPRAERCRRTRRRE